ncbi:hypothetical protein HMPREF1248_0093 [Coriobacteriaceae bacterium BV3Ac1]|nr:hypothetical protein HMPREF1248_0093 [Coriobacteriaceae bacterium BV3Ac1]
MLYQTINLSQNGVLHAGAAISGHNTVFFPSPSRSALLAKTRPLFVLHQVTNHRVAFDADPLLVSRIKTRATGLMTRTKMPPQQWSGTKIT